MTHIFHSKHPLDKAHNLDALLLIVLNELKKIFPNSSHICVLRKALMKISKEISKNQLILDPSWMSPATIDDVAYLSLKTNPLLRDCLNEKKCLIYLRDSKNVNKTFNKYFNHCKSAMLSPCFLLNSEFIVIVSSEKHEFCRDELNKLNSFVQHIYPVEQLIDCKKKINEPKSSLSSIITISQICNYLGNYRESHDIELLFDNFSKILPTHMFVMAVRSGHSSNHNIAWYHKSQNRYYDSLSIESYLTEYLVDTDVRVISDTMKDYPLGFNLRQQGIACMLYCSLPWEELTDVYIFYLSRTVNSFSEIEIKLIELLRGLFIRYLEGALSDMAVYQAQNNIILAQQAYLRLHDIRDYSTDINNFINTFDNELTPILESEPVDPFFHSKLKRMNTMITQARRSYTKIYRLKEILERSKSGMPLEKVTEFSLPEIINNIIKQYKEDRTVIEKEISFSLINELNNEIVSTYLLFIEESIINVIKNAIFFSNNSQEISIKLSELNVENLSITIQDHGVPIFYPSKELIFNPFYSTRSNPNDNSSSQGSGLGLFLSKVNMQTLKGDIIAKSIRTGIEEGRVAFILSFPRRISTP